MLGRAWRGGSGGSRSCWCISGEGGDEERWGCEEYEALCLEVLK